MIPQRTSSYTIWFSDLLGRRIKPVIDFGSLNYTLVANTIAPALKLVMRADQFPAQLRRPESWVDSWIEVWRGYDYGAERLEGDKVWFIRHIETFTQFGAKYLEIYAVDASTVLDTRVIIADSGASGAKKTAAADDLMKAVVRENLGSLAIAARQLSSTFFSVEADTSLGASVTLEFAKDSLLSVCQKAAQASAQAGTPLSFDVVLSDLAARTLQFRTYKTTRGQIRTLVFSEERKNLTNARLIEDYTGEKTYVYANGPGEGSLNIKGTASDTAAIALRPMGRREAMIDSRKATTQAGCDDEAKAWLRNYRPVVSFSADIVNTPQSPYGKAWSFGDQLPVAFEGRAFQCNIESVSVSVTKNTEDVKATVRSQREL